MRLAAKRQKQEQAIQLQAAIETMENDSSWEQMSPLLDEALARLGGAEREAVLLRFFERQSLAEIGGRLGLTENAARMRVQRALDVEQTLRASVSDVIAHIEDHESREGELLVDLVYTDIGDGQ